MDQNQNINDSDLDNQYYPRTSESLSTRKQQFQKPYQYQRRGGDMLPMLLRKTMSISQDSQQPVQTNVNDRASQVLLVKPHEASPADLGIGGILGSGLIAFLVIPAVCIYFSPDSKVRGLQLKMRPLRRDILFYMSSLAVLVFALYRRKATLLTSIVLLAWYGLYIWKLCLDQRRHTQGNGGGGGAQVSAFRERYENERIREEQNALSSNHNDNSTFVQQQNQQQHDNLNQSSDSHDHQEHLVIATAASSPDKVNVQQNQKFKSNKVGIQQQSDLSEKQSDPGSVVSTTATTVLTNTGTVQNLNSSSSGSSDSKNNQIHGPGSGSQLQNNNDISNVNDMESQSEDININDKKLLQNQIQYQQSNQKKISTKSHHSEISLGRGSTTSSVTQQIAIALEGEQAVAARQQYKLMPNHETHGGGDSGTESVISQQGGPGGNKNPTSGNMNAVTGGGSQGAGAESGPVSINLEIDISSINDNQYSNNSNTQMSTSNSNLSSSVVQFPFTIRNYIVHTFRNVFRSEVQTVDANPLLDVTQSTVTDERNITNGQQTNLNSNNTLNNINNNNFPQTTMSSVTLNLNNSNQQLQYQQSQHTRNSAGSTSPHHHAEDLASESANAISALLHHILNITYRTLMIPVRIIQFIIDLSCPDCRIHQRLENWYIATFLISFVWISFFSYCVTDIVTDWVDKLQSPNLMSLFGILLVAIPAEIPDSVNSVTVARRGYGSMGCSSCMGSQLANVCLGLGLSWFLACLLGSPSKITGERIVQIGRHDKLVRIASIGQFCNVGIIFVITVGSSWSRLWEKTGVLYMIKKIGGFVKKVRRTYVRLRAREGPGMSEIIMMSNDELSTVREVQATRVIENNNPEIITLRRFPHAVVFAILYIFFIGLFVYVALSTANIQPHLVLM